MKLVRLTLLAIIFLRLPGGAAETNTLFSTGLEAYHAGQFPEAAHNFGAAAQLQPSTGAFVNRGLAEWQRGHAGAAILAWEQARWIDPFDRQARQNLDLARSLVQVEAPEWKWFEQASFWLPPNWWVWLAGISLWLTASALTLPRFFRRPQGGWQQWLAALGFGIFLFCLAANVGVATRSNVGFALKKNTPLRLVPAQTSETITTLPAGEPVRSLKVRGSYLFVRTTLGSGWVDSRDLGLVNR